MSVTRRPDWLRPAPLRMSTLARMKHFTRGLRLHTVCESAQCPNRQECFSSGMATFMILGDICTRNCTFCAVRHGAPLSPDPAEPRHLAQAVKQMGLRYAVITSVTRDDLKDGGAKHFAEAIQEIRKLGYDLQVEVLIPDFKGSTDALETVIDAGPVVINHNIETVPRLYPEVRPQANFECSLELLKNAKRIKPEMLTKSGIMLGLGESREEIVEVMTRLRKSGCELLTVGQYLQTSFKHHPVVRYVTPSEFEEYKATARSFGFRDARIGPLVRSSYHAADMFRTARQSVIA